MAFRQNNAQNIYEYTYSQSPYGYHSYMSDGNTICVGEDSNFWTNPNQRNGNSQNAVGRGAYYALSNNLSFGSDDPCRGGNDQYRSVCTPNSLGTEVDQGSQLTAVPFVRVVKRRTTANKKERRRTQSINNAYSELRDCIPNVPADTKLSKIKTLRLATSYISYLMAVLETNEPVGGFKVELSANSRKMLTAPVIQSGDCSSRQLECDISTGENGSNNYRRVKGRTGWPQHVWALELKQEQSL